MLLCKHCNKEVKNENSKRQHEIRCKLNPERIIIKPSFGMKGKRGSNQYAKGAKFSEETKKKISEASKKTTVDRRTTHTSFRFYEKRPLKKIQSLIPPLIEAGLSNLNTMELSFRASGN